MEISEKPLVLKASSNIDRSNIKETMDIVKEEMNKDMPSLIICKDSPCMLLRRAKPLEKFKMFSIKLILMHAEAARCVLRLIALQLVGRRWQERVKTDIREREQHISTLINASAVKSVFRCVNLMPFCREVHDEDK